MALVFRNTCKEKISKSKPLSIPSDTVERASFRDPLQSNNSVGNLNNDNNYPKVAKLSLNQTRSKSPVAFGSSPKSALKICSSPANSKLTVKGQISKDIDIRVDTNLARQSCQNFNSKVKSTRKEISARTDKDVKASTAKLSSDKSNNNGSFVPNSISKAEDTLRKSMNSANRPHKKELNFLWNKPSSRRVIEVDTAISTQSLSNRPMRINTQTPILVISCDLDSKNTGRTEQGSNLKGSTVNSCIEKNKSQEALSSNSGILKKAKRIVSEKQLHASKKTSDTEVRGKENCIESTTKGVSADKLPSKVPSFFSTRNSLSDSSQYFCIKPPANKKKINDTNVSIQNTEGFSDLSYMDFKSKTVDFDCVRDATNTIESECSVYRPMNTAPIKVETPVANSKIICKTAEKVQTTSENINNQKIQPSKNSDFFFKMMYFKPIDDHQLNSYIKGVTESQNMKTSYDKASSKICNSIDNFDDTFEKKYSASRNSTANKISKKNNIPATVASHGNIEDINSCRHEAANKIKKTKSFKAKEDVDKYFSATSNPSSLKMSEIEYNTERDEFHRTIDIVHYETSSAPLFLKKPVMSANKPRVKDTNVKIESKTKTTYSKLDKLLQEMKNNPLSSKSHIDTMTDGLDAERGLFNEGSKGISSSSTTSRSTNKSYANTLIKSSGGLL